jgi:site-specific recombinase XerD
MSELRKQMKMYMELKGYSPITTKQYIAHVSNFAKYYNKSPDLLGEKEICEYLHYCITVRHLTEGSIGPIYTALKILYTKILHRIWDVNRIPRIKERRRLPVVLSPQEIKSIFDDTENIKHKAILMTIYSGGLRVSEVCNLKV